MILASRVLEPTGGPVPRGPRRARVHGSETGPGGRAGTAEEETAAEHSAPPGGGQGEAPRLGGTPVSGGRGPGLQEGAEESRWGGGDEVFREGWTPTGVFGLRLQVEDGCPLWMWRGTVDVDATEAELLHRLLRQPELWDRNLRQASVVQTLSKDTDVFHCLLQDLGQALGSRPPQEYLLLR